MSTTCAAFLIALSSTIFLSAQSTPTARKIAPASPQQQLQQVQLQRAANQRLMLDAALDTAESFAGSSLAISDAAGVDSGENLTRLVEISNGIKVAARNNDATGAANLAVEGGRILGWQLATAVNDTAEHLNSIASLAISYPLNLISSAQAYIHFAKFALEDQRLDQRARELSVLAVKPDCGAACSCAMPAHISVDTPSFQAWYRCMDACDAKRRSCAQTLSNRPPAK